MALLTTRVPPAKQRKKPGTGARRRSRDLTPFENGRIKALEALRQSIEDFDRGYVRSKCFRAKSPTSLVYCVMVKVGNANLPIDGDETRYYVSSREQVRQVLVDFYQQIKSAAPDSDLGQAIAKVAAKGSRSGFRVSALGAIYKDFAETHNTTLEIAKSYFKNNPKELDEALANRGV